MTYRHYNYRRRYAPQDEHEKLVVHERRHARSDTFYLPDTDRLAHGTGPEVAKELNLDNDDYPDGVDARFKMVQPRVTVRNYTHEVADNKRRVCLTCDRAGEPHNLRNGRYRVWCREAFARGVGGALAFKEYHYDLQDNRCGDWQPKNLFCTG